MAKHYRLPGGPSHHQLAIMFQMMPYRAIAEVLVSILEYMMHDADVTDNGVCSLI
jgi:hypothetical protein